jgi:hypothetical protein
MYLPFVDGLGDAYTAWNDTSLDPAYLPFSLPQSETLDGSLMEAWYSSSHIYSAVFVQRLPEFVSESKDLAEASSKKLLARDDVVHESLHACAELHSAQRENGHVSSDSTEEERLFSRRMRAEELNGKNVYENAYMHTVSCTEIFQRAIAEGFSWMPLRRFAACALSLGDVASSDDDEEPVLEHSTRSMPQKASWESSSSGAEKVSALDLADTDSQELEEPGVEGTSANMHAHRQNNHKYNRHTESVCGQGRKSLVEVTLMVNETAKHAVPYALNAANNAALRALAGKGFIANATLSVTLEAFPVVASEQWVRVPAS